MANTTNLTLPLIASNQDQKHVTHNDALNRLDAVVQMSVKDRDLTAPPGSPADGDRYIPASGATGAWSSWDLNIAAYQNGAWVKYTPKEGWTCWIDDENLSLSWDGAAWRLLSKPSPGGEANPFRGLIFTPGGAGQNSIWRFDVTRSANPQTAVISSIASDVITLTTATATWFFTNDQMENVSYLRIWNTTKVPVESAWVKRVNNPGTNTELQVLSAADISGWLATETIQLGDPTTITPNRVVAVDISPMMQNMLGSVFRQAGLLVKAGVILNAVAGNIGVTPTGANGSFSNVFAHMDGSLTTGQITIPCTQLSPISNSNLVFIRETDGGANTLIMGLVSVFGVWA